MDELGVCLFSLTSFDKAEDLTTTDFVSALLDDSIANLSDENNESRWSVVVLRILPNQHDGVHDWDEEFGDIDKLLAWIDELKEEIFESSQVLVVLIGLVSGGLNFLLKFAEGVSVGRLVLFQVL